ncbi:MAG: hypothetical protein ACI4JC_02720 [Faecalibacterium sp.]
MQTAVTVVNLIHDTKTETDTPVCRVFPLCLWRETLGTSGGGAAAGDPTRKIHIRIPASAWTAGYLPYAQWAALSPAEKRTHWTLKRGWKLIRGSAAALTAAEYAALEKTRTCCTVSAISDNREPLLPHWHIEGS